MVPITMCIVRKEIKETYTTDSELPELEQHIFRMLVNRILACGFPKKV